MKYIFATILGLIILIYYVPVFLVFTIISIWHWDIKYIDDFYTRCGQSIDILFPKE